MGDWLGGLSHAQVGEEGVLCLAQRKLAQGCTARKLVESGWGSRHQNIYQNYKYTSAVDPAIPLLGMDTTNPNYICTRMKDINAAVLVAAPIQCQRMGNHPSICLWGTDNGVLRSRTKERGCAPCPATERSPGYVVMCPQEITEYNDRYRMVRFGVRKREEDIDLITLTVA